MSLIRRLKNDHLEARRKKEPVALGLLTSLVSEVNMIGKDRGNRETTDAEAIAVIRTYIENAKFTIDALATSRSGMASPMYAKCTRETELLQAYLPVQLDVTQLTAIIDDFIIAQNLPRDKTSRGAIMTHLKAAYPGQYDGAVASKIVLNRLVGDENKLQEG